MTQENLKNEVLNFLKEEGFCPTIDEDGDICFKKEGDLYYVIVDNKEESPFYLVISLGRRMEEGYDMAKALPIVYEVNHYKGVKMKLYESSIVTRAEMFLENADHFKAVFYRTTTLLNIGMNEFCEEFFK